MEKAKKGDLIKLKDGRLVFVVADGEGFQNVGVYYKDFVKHGDYEIVKENDEQE